MRFSGYNIQIQIYTKFTRFCQKQVETHFRITHDSRKNIATTAKTPFLKQQICMQEELKAMHLQIMDPV